ncbi:MAG: TonB-dependent receptor, partial [Acidobacteriota bacterium]
VGANVEAVNVASNTRAVSVTNESGNYELPYLLPGIYRVSVEMAGFKKAVRDQIELRVADRMTLDFTLELGNVAESVVVTGETPLLESATASIGMIMDERRISELPVVGGNPFYLARLSPGVLSSGGRSAGNPMDQGAATGIIVNGTRSESSEAMLDGMPNMSQRNTVFSPPQDLVQEFKIHAATFDASLGHAAGAVTNVSMKSGTNTLHGSAYGFDSRLRAVPWFTNRFIYDVRTGPITEEKKKRALEGWRHQRWGATLSGPVVLPRLFDGRSGTFWTFGYEGLYIMRNLGFTGTAPTAEQGRGDFSGLLALGSRYQIYDPATIQPAPAGRFRRQPLAGNIIPASRLDPMAQKLLTYWPAANQPGTSDGRQNYFRTQNINRYNRNMSGRLDHNFSENHRVFFRLNNNQHDNRAQTMPTIAVGNIIDRTGHGAVLDDVYVFNPQLLLNLRYGVTYNNQITSRFSQGFDLLSLGFPQSLLNEIRTKNSPAGIAFPQITVDGYTGLSDGGGNTFKTYYHTFAGTLTRIAGDHSVRLGGEYRLMRENGYSYGNVAPRVDFANTWTRGPLDNSPTAPIGQGLASMLLGLPTGGQINTNASRAEQSTFSSLYIHDDWRVTRRLTLNIGLRYEYESPTTERYNRSIRGFDFQTPSPIEAQARANYARAPIPEVSVESFRMIGGLTFAGAGGQPRGLWTADRNNLAPRFGLVYQLSAKMVLRAGYGIFYDVLGIDREDVNQGGFNQPTNLIPSLDNGLTFRATLRNPFPDGLEVPLGAAGGLRTFLGRGAGHFYERPLNPYMQRWSFSVQRELPERIVAEAAYVGNRGTRLAVNRQFDAVPRQYFSTRPERDQAAIDFLSEQVPSPLYGIPEFEGTSLGNVRVGRSSLLRPFPHFTGIGVDLPIGYSYYHSLQVRAEKRMQKGFTFQAAWTWSKFMQATSYLNDSDAVFEKVISDQDFPHRFVLSGIFELPFGRGKPLAGSARGVLDGLIGGWQLQGWFEGQSGDALGFGNAIFRGDLHDIPLAVSQRRAERWFNTEAGFERDNTKQLGSNIRTFPSRFTGVRADGINNFDLSLFKNFRIREGLKTQLRMECFNALNHIQFDAPNTSPASTAFGTITGEKGHGQRQVTLGLKFLF